MLLLTLVPSISRTTFMWCTLGTGKLWIFFFVGGTELDSVGSNERFLLHIEAIDGREGSGQNFQQLVNSGASSNQNCVYPPIVAVSAGYVHIVNLLLRYGADPNVAPTKDIIAPFTVP
ncbi:predicted protein [Histoplasma capsulatum G186AR]|uniref:Ankyrin repeat protein n=1 Tax=Ajellomyces capsulatus (strain G186AR / H82 / ATCC MYA-2454 / RMSCC 2432) TaxID=447093 RepID=C0NVW7_AJECG|nr:uncharacterized protein HCBG_07297 [Histoplasma capsulatum G186AR]EEH04656.1 predicted protein [Histoplasma capsulatum G186AR]